MAMKQSQTYILGDGEKKWKGGIISRSEGETPQKNLLITATFLKTASHSQEDYFSHFLREDNIFSLYV